VSNGDLGQSRGATDDAQMSVVGYVVAGGVLLLFAPLVPVALVVYAVWRLLR
jgi:hypothetical protein